MGYSVKQVLRGSVLFLLLSPTVHLVRAGEHQNRRREFVAISGLVRLPPKSLDAFDIVSTLNPDAGVFIAAGVLSKGDTESLLRDPFFDTWEYDILPVDLVKSTFRLLDEGEAGMKANLLPNETRKVYYIAFEWKDRKRLYVIDPWAKPGEPNMFFCFVRW